MVGGMLSAFADLADLGRDVVEARRGEARTGERARGGGQDLFAPLGTAQPAAARGGCSGLLGAFSVTAHWRLDGFAGTNHAIHLSRLLFTLECIRIFVYSII